MKVNVRQTQGGAGYQIDVRSNGPIEEDLLDSLFQAKRSLADDYPWLGLIGSMSGRGQVLQMFPDISDVAESFLGNINPVAIEVMILSDLNQIAKLPFVKDSHERTRQHKSGDDINSTDFQTATAHDYADWLFAYLDNGGKPTHFYDRPMPTDFVVARRDVDLFPRYGARSAEVIVPADVTVTIVSKLGHNHVYYLPRPGRHGLRGAKTGAAQRGNWIPVFNDLVFMQRDELRTGMQRRKAQDEEFWREREERLGRAVTTS